MCTPSILTSWQQASLAGSLFKFKYKVNVGSHALMRKAIIFKL
jgi:hypothetical protein